MDGDQPAHAIPQGGVAAGQRRFYDKRTQKCQSLISRIFAEKEEEGKMEDVLSRNHGRDEWQRFSESFTPCAYSVLRSTRTANVGL